MSSFLSSRGKTTTTRSSTTTKTPGSSTSTSSTTGGGTTTRKRESGRSERFTTGPIDAGNYRPTEKGKTQSSQGQGGSSGYSMYSPNFQKGSGAGSWNQTQMGQTFTGPQTSTPTGFNLDAYNTPPVNTSAYQSGQASSKPTYAGLSMAPGTDPNKAKHATDSWHRYLNRDGNQGSSASQQGHHLGNDAMQFNQQAGKWESSRPSAFNTATGRKTGDGAIRAYNRSQPEYVAPPITRTSSVTTGNPQDGYTTRETNYYTPAGSQTAQVSTRTETSPQGLTYLAPPAPPAPNPSSQHVKDKEHKGNQGQFESDYMARKRYEKMRAEAAEREAEEGAARDYNESLHRRLMRERTEKAASDKEAERQNSGFDVIASRYAATQEQIDKAAGRQNRGGYFPDGSAKSDVMVEDPVTGKIVPENYDRNNPGHQPGYQRPSDTGPFDTPSGGTPYGRDPNTGEINYRPRPDNANKNPHRLPGESAGNFMGQASHYGTVAEGHEVPADAKDVERFNAGGNEVIKYTTPDGIRHSAFLQGDEAPQQTDLNQVPPQGGTPYASRYAATQEQIDKAAGRQNRGGYFPDGSAKSDVMVEDPVTGKIVPENYDRNNPGHQPGYQRPSDTGPFDTPSGGTPGGAQEPTFAEMDRATRYGSDDETESAKYNRYLQFTLDQARQLAEQKNSVYENRDDPNFTGPTYTVENTYIPVRQGSQIRMRTAEDAAELMMQEDKKAILEGRRNEKQRQAEEERAEKIASYRSQPTEGPTFAEMDRATRYGADDELYAAKQQRYLDYYMGLGERYANERNALTGGNLRPDQASIPIQVGSTVKNFQPAYAAKYMLDKDKRLLERSRAEEAESTRLANWKTQSSDIKKNWEAQTLDERFGSPDEPIGQKLRRYEEYYGAFRGDPDSNLDNRELIRAYMPMGASGGGELATMSYRDFAKAAYNADKERMERRQKDQAKQTDMNQVPPQGGTAYGGKPEREPFRTSNGREPTGNLLNFVSTLSDNDRRRYEKYLEEQNTVSPGTYDNLFKSIPKVQATASTGQVSADTAYGSGARERQQYNRPTLSNPGPNPPKTDATTLEEMQKNYREMFENATPGSMGNAILGNMAGQTSPSPYSKTDIRNASSKTEIGLGNNTVAAPQDNFKSQPSASEKANLVFYGNEMTEGAPSLNSFPDVPSSTSGGVSVSNTSRPASYTQTVQSGSISDNDKQTQDYMAQMGEVINPVRPTASTVAKMPTPQTTTVESDSPIKMAPARNPVRQQGGGGRGAPMNDVIPFRTKFRNQAISQSVPNQTQTLERIIDRGAPAPITSTSGAAAPAPMPMPEVFMGEGGIPTVNFAPGTLDVEALRAAYAPGTYVEQGSRSRDPSSMGVGDSQVQQQMPGFYQQALQSYQGPQMNWGKEWGDFDNAEDAFLQRDAFINRINQARTPYWTARARGQQGDRKLNFVDLLRQSREDIKEGFENPFSKKNLRPT